MATMKCNNAERYNATEAKCFSLDMLHTASKGQSTSQTQIANSPDPGVQAELN